jgi:hypothetical protein
VINETFKQKVHILSIKRNYFLIQRKLISLHFIILKRTDMNMLKLEAQKAELAREILSETDEIRETELIKTKLSDKYRGVFSEENDKSFVEHTRTMREEWNNI